MNYAGRAAPRRRLCARWRRRRAGAGGAGDVALKRRGRLFLSTRRSEGRRAGEQCGRDRAAGPVRGARGRGWRRCGPSRRSTACFAPWPRSRVFRPGMVGAAAPSSTLPQAMPCRAPGRVRPLQRVEGRGELAHYRPLAGACRRGRARQHGQPRPDRHRHAGRRKARRHRAHHPDGPRRIPTKIAEGVSCCCRQGLLCCGRQPPHRRRNAPEPLRPADASRDRWTSAPPGSLPHHDGQFPYVRADAPETRLARWQAARCLGVPNIEHSNTAPNSGEQRTAVARMPPPDVSRLRGCAIYCNRVGVWRMLECSPRHGRSRPRCR